MPQAWYYGADVFPVALEVWRHAGIGCTRVEESGIGEREAEKIVAGQMLAIEGLKEIAKKKNGNPGSQMWGSWNSDELQGMNATPALSIKEAWPQVKNYVYIIMIYM